MENFVSGALEVFPFDRRPRTRARARGSEDAYECAQSTNLNFNMKKTLQEISWWIEIRRHWGKWCKLGKWICIIFTPGQAHIFALILTFDCIWSSNKLSWIGYVLYILVVVAHRVMSKTLRTHLVEQLCLSQLFFFAHTTWNFPRTDNMVYDGWSHGFFLARSVVKQWSNNAPCWKDFFMVVH